MNIKITGINRARKRWKRYGELFSGQNDRLYRQAGELVSRSISQNFEAGGRPRWTKRKYRYAWPILWKTGRMKARSERTSLTWRHQGRRHINQIYAPYYGLFHQYGTRKLPIRRFVGLLDSERERLSRIFRRAFLKG